MSFLIDLFLHLDTHMAAVITQYGTWTYGLLFFIIFMETGFVVTPFLPGDSIIFVAGTFAALHALDVWLVFILLAVAAVLGDTANYWIGHFLGERAYHVKWIKKEYLDRTHAFFEKQAARPSSWRASFPSSAPSHPLSPGLAACPILISFRTMFSAVFFGWPCLPLQVIFSVIFPSSRIISQWSLSPSY